MIVVSKAILDFGPTFMFGLNITVQDLPFAIKFRGYSVLMVVGSIVQKLHNLTVDDPRYDIFSVKGLLI